MMLREGDRVRCLSYQKTHRVGRIIRTEDRYPKWIPCPRCGQRIMTYSTRHYVQWDNYPQRGWFEASNLQLIDHPEYPVECERRVFHLECPGYFPCAVIEDPIRVADLHRWAQPHPRDVEMQRPDDDGPTIMRASDI